MQHDITTSLWNNLTSALHDWNVEKILGQEMMEAFRPNSCVKEVN